MPKLKLNRAAWTLTGARIGFLLALTIFLVPGALTQTGCSGKSKAEKLHAEGHLFYKNQQYYKAIQRYEDSLKLQPERVDTLRELADCYLKTGKPEEAIKHSEQIVRLEPDNAQAYLMIGQAHLALASSRENAVSGSTGKSFDQKELDQAAAIAAKLREKNPDSVEGMLLQAHIEQLNRKLDAAEALYKTVLEKDPKNFNAQVGLTETLLGKKDFATAEQMARKALENTEGSKPAAVSNLAWSLALQRRFDEAYDALAPYTKPDNQEPNANLYLLAGRILLNQLALHGDRGTSASTILGSENQLTTETQQAGGTQKTDLARLSKNLDGLSQVMKSRFPSIPASYFYRAFHFELQNNMTEAIRNFEQACQRDPGSKQYRMALAVAHMKTKNFSLARQELRTLLKNHPGDFDAQLRLAQCFASEGSYEQAIDGLRTLKISHPNNLELNETLGRVLVLTSDPSNVEEGLKLLAEAQGDWGTPGGKELLMGQAAFTDAQTKAAEGKMEEARAKFKEAERLFQEAERVATNKLPPWLKLADMAVRRRDLLTGLRYAHKVAEQDPRYQPLEAGLFKQLGQTDNARKMYQDLLKASPDSIGYELALADLDVQSGKLDAARQSYESIAKRHPDNSQTWLRQAALLEKMDSLETAVGFLRAGPGKFPNDIMVRVTLAQGLLKIKEHAEAAKTLADAAQLLETKLSALRGQPGATEQALSKARVQVASLYYELALNEILSGQHKEAREHLARVRENTAADNAGAGIGEWVIDIQEGKGQQAAEALQKLPAETVKSIPSLPLLVSLAWLSAGDVKQSRQAVEKRPELNQNTIKLYLDMLKNTPDRLQEVSRGLALQVLINTRPDYAAATLVLAEEGLKTLPKDPFLLTRKAEALERLGRGREALETYQTVQQVMPDFSTVLQAQGDLHQNLADQAAKKGDRAAVLEGITKAILLYQQYLAKEPKDTGAIEKLASVFQKIQKIDEANREYKKLIEIDPKNGNAYNNLAWNLAEANQLEEAAKMGEKALELAPNVSSFQDTLGWIEFKRGNVDRALDLLTRASVGLPNNPDIRFHLAQALQARGRREEALTELETIARAMPKYARIKDVRGMIQQINPQSEVLTPGRDQGTTATQAASARP